MSKRPSVNPDATERKESKEKIEKRLLATPSYAKHEFECPEVLQGRARIKWAELVELIGEIKQNPLTDADKDIMTIYCNAWADFEYFDAEIKREPDLYILLSRPDKDGNTLFVHAKNRNYEMRKLAYDTIIKCGNNLCLDPTSRARIGLARVNADNDTAASIFANIINRKGD